MAKTVTEYCSYTNTYSSKIIITSSTEDVVVRRFDRERERVRRKENKANNSGGKFNASANFHK